MPRKLDISDLTILDGLADYGFRNISYVASKLGIPDGTLRKRLKRLSLQIFSKIPYKHLPYESRA